MDSQVWTGTQETRRFYSAQVPLFFVILVGLVLVQFLFGAARREDVLFEQHAERQLLDRIEMELQALAWSSTGYRMWAVSAGPAADRPGQDAQALRSPARQRPAVAPGSLSVLVLGADRRVTAVMVAGEAAPSPRALGSSPSLAVLLGLVQPYPADQPAVSGLVEIGGEIHLAAAGRLPGPGGAAHAAQILLLVRPLRAVLVDKMGRRGDEVFKGLRILAAPPPDWSSLPLRGADGTVLGVLAWDPDMPGDRFLRLLLPAMAGGLAVIALPIMLMWRQMRDGARQLEQAAALLAERNAALAESEARYQMLARIVPVGIFQTDHLGRYIYGNDRGAALLALPVTPVAALDWLAAVHRDDRHRVRQRWQEALRQTRPLREEFRVEAADRSERWVLVEAVPQRKPAGQLAGFTGSITDLTDYKRATDALLEARRDAERANRAKSQFFAAASHDLRQPLHALRLFLGVLAMGQHPPRTRDLIDKMDQSLKTTEELLNSLLDLARLEAGVIEPSVETVDLAGLLVRLEQVFGIEAEHAGLTLRVVPCRIPVRSDPMLLERILRNLLSNALRYTRHGRVLLGCRRQGDRLRIEVWDTGPGIPPDQMPKIFEEFYQIAPPGHERRQGLGLGLAIVARLAILLDHPVGVRSTPGRGSVFSVTVPVATAGRPPAAETPAPPPAAVFAGTLVAVVDDEPSVLSAMSLTLTSWGCEAVAAETAETLVDRLIARGRTPDLVIADLRLRNGENGMALIATLRRQFAKTIPGIILTGDTTPELGGEAARMGLVLLYKPVNPEHLRARVAEALAQRHLDGPLGRTGASTQRM